MVPLRVFGDNEACARPALAFLYWFSHAVSEFARALAELATPPMAEPTAPTPAPRAAPHPPPTIAPLIAPPTAPWAIEAITELAFVSKFVENEFRLFAMDALSFSP